MKDRFFNPSAWYIPARHSKPTRKGLAIAATQRRSWTRVNASCPELEVRLPLWSPKSTPEQQATFEAEGRRFVIRFKIEDEREIVWNDMVRADELARVIWAVMVVARASVDGIGQPLQLCSGGRWHGHENHSCDSGKTTLPILPSKQLSTIPEFTHLIFWTWRGSFQNRITSFPFI